MPRTRLTALAAALACLALPASASAATVSADAGGDEEPATLEYTAGANEANKLDIEVTGATATIDDPGASSITPGANCTTVTPKKVTCTLPGPFQLARVQLLDDNDTLEISGVQVFANGGAGSDTLGGSALSDVLNGGGGGTDELNGNAGLDDLNDGDTSGAANADELNGGADEDTGAYRNRTARVVVDLADTNGDGESGEDDELTSIEHAVGGSGNDDLRGTAVANRLSGADGRDHIEGRAGDDMIDGGDDGDHMIGAAGFDSYDAGDGNNTMRLDNPPGTRDRYIFCGDDRDLIIGLGVSPSVAVPCERADFGFGFVPWLHPREAGTRSITMKIPCPAVFRDGDLCRGSILVEPKGAYKNTDEERREERFAYQKFNFTTATGRITIPLNSDGRRELAKSVFRLQYTVALNEQPSGTKRRFSWTGYVARSALR